jgi:hypothetical protein
VTRPFIVSLLLQLVNYSLNSLAFTQVAGEI